MLSNRKYFKSLAVIIFIFSVLGLGYRLFLSSLLPHPPIADEKTYIQIAEEIQKNFFVAECCTRGFVYPMFLAIIFSLFDYSLNAIIFFQSLIDVGTGILLFFISYKVFKNYKTAFVAFLLYLINPLTSSYTGLILTEILAIFLVTISLFFIIWERSLRFIFLAGIFMGFFMFNRLMYFYFGLGIVFFLIIIYRREFIAFVLGIGLVILYPFYANWITYKHLSPLPYVPAGNYDYIISYQVKRWPAILSEYYRELDPIIKKDYQINFNDREEFIKETGRRMELLHKDVLKNPVYQIGRRISFIPIFWNKSNLYYYNDPFYPEDKPIIQFINAIFLFFSLTGLIIFIFRRPKTKEQFLASWFTLFLVLYLTFALLLRVPEERHSLPAYPLLLLFFIPGLSGALSIWRGFRRR